LAVRVQQLPFQLQVLVELELHLLFLVVLYLMREEGEATLMLLQVAVALVLVVAAVAEWVEAEQQTLEAVQVEEVKAVQTLQLAVQELLFFLTQIPMRI
jgi:hypothetical protein